MLFHRRWVLILFALIAGGGQIFAASREERDYAAAAAAFHDKFYDRAAAGLTQFLQAYGKSTNAASATLLLAQSEFYLGKFTNTIVRLSYSGNVEKARAAGIADQYLYWLAEAQFGNNDFTNAARTFVSLANDFPNSPLAVTAIVEAASAHARLKQWLQLDDLLGRPDGVFQRAAKTNAPGKIVADGRLLQSESKFAQEDFAGAIQVLKLLPAALPPEQDWQRSYQLYRADLRLDELAAALGAATNLFAVARAGHGGVWATNLAESVACQAGVLEKLDRRSEALAIWGTNLLDSVPADYQRRAVLKIAELSAAENNLPGAEDALEKFVAQFPDAPAADLAMLTLGELHLKNSLAEPSATNHLIRARTSFDQLLGKDRNGPFAGKAFLDRGWCDWLLAAAATDAGDTNTARSFADFSSAAQRLPLSEDLAVARFKMGDAQFALTNFAGALTNYQAVVTEFSSLPSVAGLGDQALYQMLRAQLALRGSGGLGGVMSQFIARFFTNAPVAGDRLLTNFFKHTPADSSLLLGDFGDAAKVRGLFERFAGERKDSPLLPQVLFAIGRTFEHQQLWQEAANHYQDWLKLYGTTNDLGQQVEFSRDYAVWQTGDEPRAFDLFNQFISHFPTNSALAPLAHWWIADHFFRLGDTNFVQAELNYQLIFQYFPKNQLAWPAQLMAGRCAMNRNGYTDAEGYFFPLTTNSYCPEDLRDQARFGYCEALRQMPSSDTNTINLQNATNLLAQMTPKAATNIAGALAWSEMADCDWQLGDFDAATNAYAQVLNSPMADVELRSRAKVGLGTVLKMKADLLPPDQQQPLLSLALRNYTDVIYTTNEVADPRWMKEAALQALPLMMKLKEGEVNQFFDRLEYWLPALKDVFEKDRLTLAQ